MELAALQSIMSTRVADVLGSLLPTMSTMFPSARWLSPDAGPRLFGKRVHPLVSSTSPSEYVAAFHLPDARGLRAPPLGFGFPFAARAHEVHLVSGFPHPTTFRPQRFSHSRRFAPSRAGADLFHSAATSGIRSSGVFLAAKPAHLIGESYPHVVAGFLLTASCPAAARSPRFAFRVSVRAAIRCSRKADWAYLLLDPLLGFQLLRAFLRLPWRRLHAPSTHGLYHLALTVYEADDLQRINQQPT